MNPLIRQFCRRVLRSGLQYHPIDRIWLAVLQLTAMVTGGVLFLILGLLWAETWPMLSQIGIERFVTDPDWYPTAGEFNLLPMIIGSLLVTLGAMAIAMPFGIGSAIFCQYYAPSAIAQVFRRMLELLAGIPSVVFGFWGLVVLVPIIAKVRAPGTSLLTGIIILALMILPTIALVAESSFKNLPQSYWRSSASMGLRRWSTIWSVCIPAARVGLWTSVVLGLGRAIGETMAVLMVCGNAVKVPESLFDPVRTLTANMALEMAYAVDLHRSSLFVSALFLVLIVSLSMVLIQRAQGTYLKGVRIE